MNFKRACVKSIRRLLSLIQLQIFHCLIEKLFSSSELLSHQISHIFSLSIDKWEKTRIKKWMMNWSRLKKKSIKKIVFFDFGATESVRKKSRRVEWKRLRRFLFFRSTFLSIYESISCYSVEFEKWRWYE